MKAVVRSGAGNQLLFAVLPVAKGALFFNDNYACVHQYLAIPISARL